MLIDENKDISLKPQNLITKDFVILVAFIMFIFVCLSGWFISKTYRSQTELITHTLHDQAERVTNTLTDVIDYTQFLMSYIGSQIEKNHDLEFISTLLQSNLLHNNEILTYSILGWINKDKQLIASSRSGIMKEPIDASARNYFDTCQQHPGKIQLDSPKLGLISKILSIPVAMGVNDRDNKYLGTIVTGFPLRFLSRKLNHVITVPGVSYAMFDSNFSLITANKSLFYDYETIRKLQTFLKENKNIKKDRFGPLSQISWTGNGVSSFYIKLSNSPYLIVTTYDPKFGQTVIRKAVTDFTIQSLVIALLIIVSLYMIRRLLVSPIVSLSKIADQIAGGEENIIVEPLDNMPYEIVNLRNQLLRIISHNEQERKTKQELYTTKNKLEIANNQIIAANEQLEHKIYERTIELEKLLQYKTEFLNSMSHEVRTPIQGITAISKGLAEHWSTLTENKKHMLVEELAANSDRLFSLVNNILDYSKFNAGEMDLEITKINLHEVVFDTINECRVLFIKKKNLTVRVEQSQDLPEIMADKVRIAQVIRNLLANAIKFTDYGEILITLSLSLLHDENNNEIQVICFKISDEGIGIPDNELETIFEPFMQSSRTKMKAGSTGLGLSISKKIIAAHHGKMSVQHNYPKGTTFKFMLPLTYQPDQQIKYEQLPETTANKRPNILVVDDEKICLTSIMILLQDTQYNVYTADDAEQALEVLRSNQNIDLVLLDLVMPEINGIKFLEIVKQDLYLRKIPVMILTGIYDRFQISEALNLGAVGYLEKPCTKAKLLSVIDKVIYGKTEDDADEQQ